MKPLEQKNTQVTFHIRGETYQTMAVEAKSRDITLSALFREIIQEWHEAAAKQAPK
jgi:hypothetical protein